MTITHAFAGGCHVNPATDAAYATGGFRAVFSVPGGIYEARDNGATVIIDRFPGSRWGREPLLTDFLNCGEDWARAVKGLQTPGWSLFRRRPRVTYIAYLRGLSDLLEESNGDRERSKVIVQQIVAILHNAGCKAIIEGTPRNLFELSMLMMFVDAQVYAGTEPWWDREAEYLWGYPCIQEESKLLEQGVGIDGGDWPANWRLFTTGAIPKPMLLMNKPTPKRIELAEALGWLPVAYCEQMAI